MASSSPSIPVPDHSKRLGGASLIAPTSSSRARRSTSRSDSSATIIAEKRTCRRGSQTSGLARHEQAASPASPFPLRASRFPLDVRIVAGRWRGRRISAPSGSLVRPTLDRVREAWMSILQLDLPGARVLDLYAGSGALGLEALSRGANWADFVETNPKSLRALGENIAALDAGGLATI